MNNIDYDNFQPENIKLIIRLLDKIRSGSDLAVRKPMPSWPYDRRGNVRTVSFSIPELMNACGVSTFQKITPILNLLEQEGIILGFKDIQPFV